MMNMDLPVISVASLDVGWDLRLHGVAVSRSDLEQVADSDGRLKVWYDRQDTGERESIIGTVSEVVERLRQHGYTVIQQEKEDPP